ncbi:hypothetical protein OCT63_18760, partial [Vibrio sp. RW]|uniref:hypothetical protein n=1 Tax=Vibrio sp. RW TaxID=2998833 RepID=UPI0022CD6809
KAELSENGQTSLKFEINKNGADYSLNLATTGHPGTFDISDVEPGITWSVNDDVLNINAENLDKVSRTAIATLTASHDGQQASATFEIDLKNGSLDEVIETVNVYVNDAQTNSFAFGTQRHFNCLFQSSKPSGS